MDEEQFEAVRAWGEGLRGDPREEVRAAGQAIVLLCAEIERLERELWNATSLTPQLPPPEDTAEKEPFPEVDTTLRERLRGLVGLYSRPAKR